MANWDNWIFLLLGLILSIPAGILVNIVSPSVESYLKNRTLSTKERKRQILIARYKEVKKFAESPILNKRFPEYFKVWLSVAVVLIIFALMENSYIEMLGDYYFTFRNIVLISCYILLLYVNIKITRDVFIMIDFANFDKFKARVIKKLIKLGVNPKELDKG